MGIAMGAAALAALLITFIIGYLIGNVKGQKSEAIRLPPFRKGRKGYFYHRLRWEEKQSISWYKSYEQIVLVVVEEINRIQDKSEIEILYINDLGHHKPEWVDRRARAEIGRFCSTNRITWDNTPEQKAPKVSDAELEELRKRLEVERIALTPLDDLVKAITEEKEP